MSATPPIPAWWHGPNAVARARHRVQAVLVVGALLIAVVFAGLTRIRGLQFQAARSAAKAAAAPESAPGHVVLEYYERRSLLGGGPAIQRVYRTGRSLTGGPDR